MASNLMKVMKKLKKLIPSWIYTELRNSFLQPTGEGIMVLFTPLLRIAVPFFSWKMQELNIEEIQINKWHQKGPAIITHHFEQEAKQAAIRKDSRSNKKHGCLKIILVVTSPLIYTLAFCSDYSVHAKVGRIIVMCPESFCFLVFQIWCSYGRHE